MRDSRFPKQHWWEGTCKLMRDTLDSTLIQLWQVAFDSTLNQHCRRKRRWTCLYLAVAAIDWSLGGSDSNTSILFYSYGVIVTTPNNLEVGILPRLASQGNIQLPKYKPQLKRHSSTEVYENTYVFLITSGSTEGTQTATQIQLKRIWL